MGVPESWQILLNRRAELDCQLESMKGMEFTLKEQLSKNAKRQASVRLAIIEMTESLTTLGWMPEKEQSG